MKNIGLLCPLDYFYFRVFTWWSNNKESRRRKGHEPFFGDEAPIMVVSMCLLFNAGTLTLVLRDFAHVRALELLSSSRQGYRLAGGVLFLLIAGLLYLRYSRLTLSDWNAMRFADESADTSRMRGRICVAYILFSVLAPNFVNAIS